MPRRHYHQFNALSALMKNHVGVLGWEKPFFEQPVTQFDKVMRINVYGVYHFHQAAIPHMLEGGWGRCVTMTSGARNGSPNQVP